MLTRINASETGVKFNQATVILFADIRYDKTTKQKNVKNANKTRIVFFYW